MTSGRSCDSFSPHTVGRLDYAVEQVRSRITVLNVWLAYCVLGIVYQGCVWLADYRLLVAGQFWLRPFSITLIGRLVAEAIGLAAAGAPLRRQKLNWLRASTGLICLVAVVSQAMYVWQQIYRHGSGTALTLYLLREVVSTAEGLVFPMSIYLLARHKVRRGVDDQAMIQIV